MSHRAYMTARIGEFRICKKTDLRKLNRYPGCAILGPRSEVKGEWFKRGIQASQVGSKRTRRQMQHEMRAANEHFQWHANTTERQRQVKRKAAWDIFQRQIKKQKVRVDIEDLQPHWGAAPPSGAAQQVPQGAEDQDNENTDGRSEGDQYDDQG